MATLTAAFDETGTHCGASFTCVDGYVFDQDGERRFTEKLARVLEPLKRRGIGLFHAAECNAGKKPFSQLETTQRGVLFEELVSCVRSTAKFGLASGIEDRVFREAIVQHITDTSLNILAMVNMFYGVKSTRKYEAQTGPIKTDGAPTL